MWRIRIAAERWTRDQTLAAQGAASVLVNSLSFVPHLSNWKRDLTSAVGRLSVVRNLVVFLCEYNQKSCAPFFHFITTFALLCATTHWQQTYFIVLVLVSCNISISLSRHKRSVISTHRYGD
jgi:hypothetical protein